MPVQHARHHNLHTVLSQLEAEGIVGYADQAEHLGNVTEGRLAAMALGGPIDVMFAQHVEWALHRRRGWMDELHEGDPLEV
jgi:predicted MFS family arabinose efflux permease